MQRADEFDTRKRISPIFCSGLRRAKADMSHRHQSGELRALAQFVLYVCALSASVVGYSFDWTSGGKSSGVSVSLSSRSFALSSSADRRLVSILFTPLVGVAAKCERASYVHSTLKFAEEDKSSENCRYR